MKQRIISYIALLLLTMSCSLELVENTKSLLSCSEATGVAASAQSATPLNVAMSLTGSTSDISSVVWQISKSGTEYYRSTTTASPFSLTSSMLSTDGTFTIIATITTKCGKSYSLSGSYSYTAKTCTRATGITASAQTSTPLNVALSLTGSTSDIASVVWILSQNATEYYRSSSQTNIPFSLTTPTLTTDGTFTITAQIVDKCGASYSLTSSYTVSNLAILMLPVEGGTFQMGSITSAPNEQPVHSVTLSSFTIGKYEVTQAQWKAVMGVNPSFFTSCDNCPVENVSWDDTQLFITKLNTLTGKTYRLPTEAEWEYAARGGKLSKGYTYSGSNNIDDVAWYASNSGSQTHFIGQKMANELGIYDMSGNAWEWCSDWYGAYNSSNQTNPIGSSSGTFRISRGGSWNYNPQGSRVANRAGDTPDYRGYNAGFRVVFPQ